ncbi:MAG: Mu-like prophage major head subunit gpT family protein [Acidobacteria bacterium]|nr:Mu-like prophage major head subunit gpT family protein [Acidobacteriota bacterium]
MSSHEKRRALRQRHTARQVLAADPTGAILCAAESVAVEPAVEAAEGKPARRPSFNILAYTGGILKVGWQRPVVVDLSGLRAGRTTILLDHDRSAIVGQGTATIAGGQVTVAGEITGDAADKGTPAGQIVGHARNGFQWAASVGVSPDRIESVDANQSVTVNGRDFAGPIYVVRAGRLGEVSFVGVGADEDAQANIAATAANPMNGDSNMNFAQWLVANGFRPEAELSATEKATLTAWFQRDTAKPAPAPAQTAVPVQAAGVRAVDAAGGIDAEIAEARRRTAIREAITASSKRLGTVEQVAIRLRDFQAEAIDGNWSMDRFDARLARVEADLAPLSRTDTFAIHNAGQRVDQTAVLSAAALLAAGNTPESIARQSTEPVVDAALKQYQNGIGLEELVLACARANGYRGRERMTEGNWKQLVQWGNGQIQGAFSTVDLSGLLGAVANKALAKVALSPEWLAPLIAGVASHSNFHQHTVYAHALNGRLQLVGPTGEIKHLAMAEESYTRQLATRGGLLTISRQDFINDDMGIFTGQANDMARNAMESREYALFTTILASAAGASHFTAARGNYLSGVTTNVSAAGFALAVAAFRRMKGPDGKHITVSPQIVLVPPTVEQEAASILDNSSRFITTGYSGVAAKVLSSDANVYRGRFGGSPKSSGLMEDTTITGNSAAYWYMFADPAVLPCYEISYLNGAQTPTVDYFGLETDPNVLGMTWRTYWDFGVDAANWRAGIKLAGA